MERQRVKIMRYRKGVISGGTLPVVVLRSRPAHRPRIAETRVHITRSKPQNRDPRTKDIHNVIVLKRRLSCRFLF